MTSNFSPSDDQILAETQAWLEKAVIGLNLCPFAKSVYIKKQVRMVVSRARHLDALLEELDAELGALAAVDPEVTDTTLLILADQLDDFLDFNDFLTVADEAVSDLGLDGVLQIASFHPDFQFEGTDADDITNFTNRAPYPTLHLLREASIDRAVVAFPDAEDIFGKNMETLRTLGHEGWRALGVSRRK